LPHNGTENWPLSVWGETAMPIWRGLC
jgi:hypothetical protein